MEFEFLENELDEKTKSLIQKMENELKSKDKELESKDKKIDDLKNELDYLKRQLLNKNRKIFGKSSEQVDVNQMSLFDEAEKNSDPKAAEPILEETTYLRNKTPKYVGKKDNLAHLERVVIEHKLEVECSERIRHIESMIFSDFLSTARGFKFFSKNGIICND